MTKAVCRGSLFLFVPADRPERFGKAAAAKADVVILDLEDAVAPNAKSAARKAIASAASELGPFPFLVRVNGIDTPWHAADLELIAQVTAAGVMLPKVNSPAEVAAVRALIGQRPIVALIETVAGLANVEAIAAAADRIAFGSIDFAADLGCRHERDALLYARSRMVLAARLAGRPAPIDGVTRSLREEGEIISDARHAAALGFSGKLLIHPAQVLPTLKGFIPDDAEVAWAKGILAGATQGAAVAADGGMVDAPVILRAEQIIATLRRFQG